MNDVLIAVALAWLVFSLLKLWQAWSHMHSMEAFVRAENGTVRDFCIGRIDRDRMNQMIDYIERKRMDFVERVDRRPWWDFREVRIIDEE